MDEYTSLLSLTEEAYNKSYQDAIILYKNFTEKLNDFDKNKITESATQPMHPCQYYSLIDLEILKDAGPSCTIS